MSELTPQDIDRLAALARIEIDASSTQAMLHDLRTTLELIDQLQAVDTSGVQPMTHPGDTVLRLRDDQVTESDQRDRLQRGAPAVEAGLYLVPRVIE
ncbi:MAG: Glutamyl-tRNA(Gln) amidotransferase subunit [Pseudomonadota bacterium]|jgi:aspartyl-tRNA(Asn)/glutamyl-tRNA(Gln) amidotransferase subunit C